MQVWNQRCENQVRVVCLWTPKPIWEPTNPGPSTLGLGVPGQETNHNPEYKCEDTMTLKALHPPVIGMKLPKCGKVLAKRRGPLLRARELQLGAEEPTASSGHLINNGYHIALKRYTLMLY